MKKHIIIFILILAVLAGISVISAAENVSDDVLEIADEIPVIEEAVSQSVESGQKAEDLSSQVGSVSGNDSSPVGVAVSQKEVYSSPSDSIKFKASNVKSSYGKKVTFSVKLSDGKGNPLKNKSVKFKVAGKTYDVNSNSKGVAKISLKLDAGEYKIKYLCGNFSGKKTITIKNYLKITIYKWKSGADVKRNKKISGNIPNSALVNKIIKAAKKGTPVIKFKGGKGKKVFLTAGVHGNEISSQIAALKLIKYLESHPIKGTVYVMPFINPKATANNVRDYKGVHLNQKANVKGTISYKTVNLIKKFKCDAYGDFHCTRPGGKPGKNVAMGTYNPTAKSADMAKYIAKKSKVKYLIYEMAGAEYPGALEDTVSLNHIPAVTCEVITPHGQIAKGSVGKSLSMMKSLLKFNGVI